MMRRPIFALSVLLATGCSPNPLPNGYAIQESGMNREWLQNPDGSMVVPGPMKGLYRKRDQLLLIAHVASADGQPLPPRPIDNTCFVALSVDTATGKASQVTLATATNLAKEMTEVFSTNRDC
jgi:hypothetical protein